MLGGERWPGWSPGAFQTRVGASTHWLVRQLTPRAGGVVCASGSQGQGLPVKAGWGGASTVRGRDRLWGGAGRRGSQQPGQEIGARAPSLRDPIPVPVPVPAERSLGQAMDAAEQGRRSAIRDPRRASPGGTPFPKLRVHGCPSPFIEQEEEFLKREDAGILHYGDSQVERGLGHQSLTPPLPLESSPRMPGGGGPGRGSGRFCF